MSQSLLTQILLPKGERLPTSKQNDTNWKKTFIVP